MSDAECPTYPKIQTVFKRDDHGNILLGNWTNEVFEYLATNTWQFTEKVDGTNIRVHVPNDIDGPLHFYGRTNNAEIPVDLLTALHNTFDPLEPILHTAFEYGACLYGEGYGPKINNGGKYRDTPGFVLFDVKVGRWWLRRKSIELIFQNLGVDIVPVIGEGTLNDAVSMARNGLESQWGYFEAEGVVARPSVELTDRTGRRIITKIKCRDLRGI